MLKRTTITVTFFEYCNLIYSTIFLINLNFRLDIF